MSDTTSTNGPKQDPSPACPRAQKPMPDVTPDQAAAHILLTEIRTRVATQALPFQKGVEQRALTSLYQLFELAREAIKDNLGCKAFAQATVRMLNQDLRPFTTDWHRRSVAGELATRDGSVAFRQDLMAVQQKLREYADELHRIAYGTSISDTWGSDLDADKGLDLSEPLILGVRSDGLICASVVNELNTAETAEIRAIRIVNGRADENHKGLITEGVGLAFSGGGIRSASFALGVTQALAEKGLLKGFDLMSTVSGGGFTGGVISREMPLAGESVFSKPDGPDTDQVAHIRFRASYLMQGARGRAQALTSQLLAGMLLNWTAPGLLIAVIALILVWVPDETKSLLAMLPIVALIVSVLAFLLYGALLNFNPKRAEGMLAFGLSLAMTCLVGYFVFIGYDLVPLMLQSTAKWTLLGVVAVVLPVIFIAAEVMVRPAIQKAAIATAMVIAGIIVPLICLGCGMLLYYLGELPMDPTAHWASPLRYFPGHLILLAILLVLAMLSRMIDINLTGPHRIYRDSLARTFIQSGDTDAKWAPLVGLNPTHRAPHHLINAVINLPNSRSVKLGERKGDFYFFSKTHCGSPTTGYHETSKLEVAGEAIDLGTAIAASGAAVAPHMALLSVAPARSLLAFLNLRLGFWLGISRNGKLRNRPGFGCLMSEMLGRGMHENADWIFLTDGGHIENSGIYELLRRRCRYIVAVDAGADAPNTFGTQATLSRHALIDMGIEIEMKLDDLRVDLNNGLSPSHAVLSKITYPAEENQATQSGLLLTVKLSLTGDEDEMIRAYRAEHPEFPIQSTADQFFDEAQFENYRRLGVHAVRSLFSRTLIGTEAGPSDVGSWLRRLAHTLRP